MERSPGYISAMAIPDYQSLMLPVLAASQHGEIRTRNVVDQLAEQAGLTPEEKAQLKPSGDQTIFYNRVHWAIFFLSKAGLIEYPRRGYINITPRGRSVLSEGPSHINNTFLLQFEEFRQFKKKSGEQVAEGHPKHPDQVEIEKNTPDEIMRAAHQQIEESLAQELLNRIQAAPAAFFERLIVDLLLKMKFGGSARDPGRTLGRSGDGGVDGVIDQDDLGLDRIYVQAKRYAVGNNIGPGPIREFFGSLDRHKATKGLFVTSSTFTASARETAEGLSKRIVLIDSEQLAKLMIRYGVGVRDEEALVIKKIDEDFFSTPE